MKKTGSPPNPSPERAAPAVRLSSRLAQAGSRWDTHTGAISMPVYHATTYRHPALGQSTGYDYTRTANPTRLTLETVLADAEGGARACAFSSGLAAVHAVASLFRPGDTLIANEDPYGGTYRLFETVLKPLGIAAVWCDTTDLVAVRRAWTPAVKAVFVETPSNPLLRISDLRGLAGLAHRHGAQLIVDNTFMTPVLQRPMELGADWVVYSGTKYLGGHNDVLAGIAIARTAADGERLACVQNAIGATLGPQDAWLMLRGLKTLELRLQRQQENAVRIAHFLARHPAVARVYFPGLPASSGAALQRRQAGGPGAMISLEVKRASTVKSILSRVRLFLFAESLGGVESLITYPERQTHADIEPARRRALGISNRLLRLSVGIEDVDDLIADLKQALAS